MDTPPEFVALATVQPDGWPRPRGYAHAWKVPAGHDLVLTAGQIGWNEQEQFVSDDFVGQFEQALRNCVTLIETAGGGAKSIVRLTMYCRGKRMYLDHLEEVGRVYRQVMGKHFPAMSLVEVSDLVEDRALVEIEATAAIPPVIPRLS